MKKLVILLCVFIGSAAFAQEKKSNFFKEVYNDFLKYGTFYAAGNVGNAKMENKEYFVRTNPDDLYAIPDVVDETVYHPYDYRYGFGIRKLARFDYESKPGNFWTGDQNIEKQTALSAPTSAVKGLEYLLHWEKERQDGEEFTNKRLFVRHTGKYHIGKFEAREQGNVGFEYTSGEIRARLPIGKKFSISAGAIYRTHQQPYGYNPIEIWLNETAIWTDPNTGESFEYPANPWYSLGFLYGYDDIYYTSTDENGVESSDWYWIDGDGSIVAYTDLQFRDDVFFELMNRFNEEAWSELEPFAEIAPIVGFDFYHYKANFWLHAYGNYILPYHKYVRGNEDFSYLHRNSWGKGGHNDLLEGEQWDDYQAGIVLGWKVNKSIGVFIEGEYTKFWDSKIFNSNFGVNFTFR
tara:strand:- start:63 stop:1283 length:1221 start_codon:yes stop_codon:yes gene_type:complete